MRAANANTIELAKENLGKALAFVESNGMTEGICGIFIKNPKNDVGFWYDNMKAAYIEFDSLTEVTTNIEKTMLINFRESLVENGIVTCPEGISIYPNNFGYFLWSLTSLIGAIIFWCKFFYERYNYLIETKQEFFFEDVNDYDEYYY